MGKRKLNTRELILKSKEIRRDIVKVVAAVNISHIGTALSCVDILTTLYFNVANVDTKRPKRLGRDRIISSKGHGSIGLIATLANRGFFSKRRLDEYCANGSLLTGHITKDSVPGIEATTGSLGHGLPMGAGMALAIRADKLKSNVYVLLSDGELDEGSNWEAILAAGNFGLDNLIAIVDYNKIQSLGTVRDVMDLEPLVKKWEAFKWSVKRIDGHNFDQLSQTLGSCPFQKGRPSVIIADTVKGKGVSFMENKLEWHYKSPDQDQLKQALKELS